MKTKPKLTAGGREFKRLAARIEKLAARVMQSAGTVQVYPQHMGRINVLRQRAAELTDYLDEIRYQRCRVCGCTQQDCGQCVEKTGDACSWVERDLCSACVE